MADTAWINDLRVGSEVGIVRVGWCGPHVEARTYTTGTVTRRNSTGWLYVREGAETITFTAKGHRIGNANLRLVPVDEARHGQERHAAVRSLRTALDRLAQHADRVVGGRDIDQIRLLEAFVSSVFIRDEKLDGT